MSQQKKSITMEESMNDNLTGLFSRSYFQESLALEIEKVNTYKLPISLAFFNLDQFSHYNTRHGYFQGDALLKKIAKIISRNVREHDIPCRYKEDEFVVIFPRTYAQEALSIVDQIRIKVDKKHPLTISAGISEAPKHASAANQLVKKAHKALSQAKIRGKNQGCIFTNPINTLTHDQQATILIVDDMQCNINYIERILSPMSYTFLKASDGVEALSVVKHQKPDLILLDVMMPKLNGFEVCRQLKHDEHTRLIPIVLITTLDTLKDQLVGIEVGADDFLIKPFEKLELVAKTKSLLKTKYLNDQMENLENVLFSLAKAVEAKDKYTLGHTERVTYYATLLGRQIGLGDRELNALRIGGALHDIGKIGIPEPILNKQGSLTPEEWEIIKKHPASGFTICLPLKDTLGDALSIIRHHHEKLNGGGYPDGLKGEDISLLTRITTIADIYDALTSNRPYRKNLPEKEALKILKKEAVQGLLDQKVVCIFEKLVS